MKIDWHGLCRVLGTTRHDLVRIANLAPISYRSWQEPKRGDGHRLIDAPRPLLRELQSKVARYLCTRYSPPDTCHSYIRGKSVRSAMLPHLGLKHHIITDLKGFFPSISNRTVYQVFKQLGFTPDTARTLTQICTFNGSLPQGSPASPVLSNLAARQLDKSLRTFAANHELKLSRYGDDVILSASTNISNLLPAVKNLMKSAGFRFNDRKCHYKIGPFDALGIQVRNNRLTISTEIKKRIRTTDCPTSQRGLLAFKRFVEGT